MKPAFKPLKRVLLTDLVKNPKNDIVDGPFGSRLKASEYVDDGVPIVRLQNIDRNRFIDKNIKFVTPQKAKDIARHHFVAGDILVSKLGDPLGEACIAPDHLPYGILVADVVRVRPNNAKVDTVYLSYALNSATVAAQFTAETKGTTRPRVNLQKIRDLEIPIAESLPEQRRIVTAIEKQFTRLEVGVAALRRVQANLKRYRAAVLKAACEGRLVPTEAELAKVGNRKAKFEAGEALLARILTERRKNWQGRGQYKEPVATDTTSLQPLPDGWTWASSSQLLREVKDGTHDTPAYRPTGIPFITQKHVKPIGLVFKDYKFISKEDHAHFYQRSNPERGDILVSMIGVNRGESCIINNDEVFSIKNVGLFKPDHSLSNAKFIQYYLSSRLGQQLILKQSKGGAQPFIGLTELRAWPIPLPPLAEQTRIVAEVERRFSVVEELEATVSGNLLRAIRLRQSILQKAFTGGLA